MILTVSAYMFLMIIEITGVRYSADAIDANGQRVQFYNWKWFGDFATPCIYV